MGARPAVQRRPSCTMEPMTVSVIIPTLNEAACLAETLRSVRAEKPREIIVVDGGSNDGTCERAAEADRVLHGPRGRAAQMNHGAAHAAGDVLLFLHADCTLEAGALAAAEKCLAGRGVAAGCFRMTVTAPGPVYRLIDACATARVRLTGLMYGDQGLFVERRRFDAGGRLSAAAADGRRVHQSGAAPRGAGSGRAAAYIRVAAALATTGRGAADASELDADGPGGKRRPPGSTGGLLPGGALRRERRTPMPLPTLLRQGSPLAEPINQLRILAEGKHPPFEQTLAAGGLSPLRATRHRGLAGQRRQTLQPDLPPLSRRRRPGTPRDHVA